MSSKIRILFTIPNFKTAGSQYVLLSIIRKIDRELFEPFIAIEKQPELIPDDIPLETRIQFLRSGKVWVDIKRFSFLLKENKIDIVHSWDHKSEAIEAIASRMAGVKYIFTKKNNAWSKRWKIKSQLAHHIAYDNPEMKIQFFSSIFFKNKISFIPHGVDRSLFKPLEKRPHSSFNLCCVGNVVPNKNQLFLVKCMVSLPNKFHLHLYGRAEEEYLKKVEKQIRLEKLENRVFYHGFVKNVELPEVFRNNDVLVLASDNEGLPVSILEGLACGLPVVASNSGGGTDYILKNEKGGYIFEKNKEKQFIQKVVILEQDSWLYQEKKKEAEQLIENRFDLQQEVDAYQSLYLRIHNNG